MCASRKGRLSAGPTQRLPRGLPLVLMSKRYSLLQASPSATTSHGWLTGPCPLPSAPFMAQRRSPRPGQPQVTRPSPPCSHVLAHQAPHHSRNRNALSWPPPSLESWATGSSVTGQSRGPGCRSLLQPVQQRQRLCQSCRLHARAAGHPQTSALPSQPPPPHKPAAYFGQKHRDYMGK